MRINHTQLASNSSILTSLDQKPIKNVEICCSAIFNQTGLADDYILSRMQLEPRKSYSQDNIRAGTERLYGQGTIARINTAVKTPTMGNMPALSVWYTPMSWQPMTSEPLIFHSIWDFPPRL